MAEAPPTTHVRMEMWKALCCRTSKVTDQSAKPPGDSDAEKRNGSVVAITRQPGAKEHEVVLFVSPQLLARGLFGKIVKSLEKKQLEITQMELRVLPKAELDKFFASRKLKHKQDEKAPCLLVSVKGEDAINRVKECCEDVGKQHALTRLDLVWSTSSKEAKKDLQLLFPPKGQFVIPISPIVPPSAEQPPPVPVMEPAAAAADAAETAMDDPAQEVSIEEPKESPKEPAPA